MPHSITYNSAEEIIELKIWGNATYAMIKDISAEVIQIAKRENCFRILNDMRQTTLEFSTLDIYEMPKMIAEIAST